MNQVRHDAAQAARIVVESGAVYTRSSGDPFFFASGWASPIFIDIKRLISVPGARDTLIDMALSRIDEAHGRGAFDLVAGCELAGVPFATLMADRLRLPLVVVRKQGKGFGRLAQFEGTFEPGVRTLLVDDLSTDGITKSTFASALERAEAKVVDTFVLLDYGVFGLERKLLSLMTLADVLSACESSQTLSGRVLQEVKDFAANAPAWSKRNGGIDALPEAAS
jgi:orotate phosphoribosyltransferase